MKAKALVIGNASYKSQPLDNPSNDANDIAVILQRLEFEITLVIDADKIQQDKSITDFATSLDNFEIGLFYFAGHGFQIDNENYLAAIDTDFNDIEHAKHTAFPLNMLLSYLNKAKNKTNIIILDACREMLQKKAWYRQIEDAGLAPIFAPKGTIIAFATSPGEKAADGVGQRNGIYTSALLQHMVVENIPIEEMFKRVRNTVYAFTKGKQTSWEHTSLTGSFYFNYGQLSYSPTIKYSIEAIQDNLYGANSNQQIDLIIKSLKTYNWYKQNPAIDTLYDLNIKNEDKNQLFVLGRNILQAACGSSGSAMTFMEDLRNNIDKFSDTNSSHILNGIIYETFFNSYGSFRQDELKKCYLDEIWTIIEDKDFEDNKKFLHEILLPYRDIIFYIPYINDKGISLDLQFQDSQDGPKLLSIKYEGEEILQKEKSSNWGFGDEILSYKQLEFQNLKHLIKEEINVPIDKIILNTNFPIANNTIINYPKYYKILK